MPDGTIITVDTATGVAAASACSPVASDCWVAHNQFVNIRNGASGASIGPRGWLEVRQMHGHLDQWASIVRTADNWLCVRI
jgi:hypothetical protein